MMLKRVYSDWLIMMVQGAPVQALGEAQDWIFWSSYILAGVFAI